MSRDDQQGIEQWGYRQGPSHKRTIIGWQSPNRSSAGEPAHAADWACPAEVSGSIDTQQTLVEPDYRRRARLEFQRSQRQSGAHPVVDEAAITSRMSANRRRQPAGSTAPAVPEQPPQFMAVGSQPIPTVAHGYQQLPQAPQPPPYEHYQQLKQAHDSVPQWQAPEESAPVYSVPQSHYPPHYQIEFPRPIAGAPATAASNQRLDFIRRTYLHLLGAVALFVGLEVVLFKVPIVFKLVSAPLTEFALATRFNWLIVLAAFFGAGAVADKWARSSQGKAQQYLGLGVYVVAEAIIFVPLLWLAQVKAAYLSAKFGYEVTIIRDAAYLTVALFGGLTASVLITKKDFSFLRGGLCMAAGLAVALVVMSLVIGIDLGMVFSAAMIAMAAGYVLYYTSQVLAHYRPTQHVAAALALFSSLALMFWYIIRVAMRMRESS